MKNKFIWFTAGIVCLLIIGAAAPSIYTPWTAFLGTNQVLVATNPSTGKIVIGPATPISTTASNAASAIVGASNANYVLIQSGAANLLKSTNETDYGTLTVQGNSGFPGSVVMYGTNGANYAELRANKDVPSNSSWVLPTNGMAGNTVGLMLATNTAASTGQLSVATIGGGLALSADGKTLGIGSISNAYVLIQNGTANALQSTNQTNFTQIRTKMTTGQAVSPWALEDTNGNTIVHTRSNGVWFLGTNATGWLQVSNNTATTNQSLGSGGNAPSIYIGPGGNVGINSNAPVHPLDVAGVVTATSFTMADGTASVTNISGTAVWQTSGGGSIFKANNQIRGNNWGIHMIPTLSGIKLGNFGPVIETVDGNGIIAFNNGTTPITNQIFARFISVTTNSQYLEQAADDVLNQFVVRSAASGTNTRPLFIGTVVTNATKMTNGITIGTNSMFADVSGQTNAVFEFRNNGTRVGECSTNGFASYNTLATNAIAGVGYTNNTGAQQTAMLTATAVAFTLSDRSGNTLYVSPTLTATMPVPMQPGWRLTAGSGLSGTVLPW